MPRPTGRPAILAGSLAAALLGATCLSAAPLPVAATTAPAQAADMVDVVSRAAPAIVSIAALHSMDADNGTDAGHRHGARASGFILSEDGRIVTSAQAVADAELIRVRTADGQVLDAQVLGVDPFTDIAVLKVEASGLTSLAVAGSDALAVGEPVLALGPSSGARYAVSSGVISAIGADTPDGPPFDIVQTDAEIGRGNQGGPLLNEAGEVIAVNARHVASSEAPMGVTLAVPADTAASVIKALSANGRMDRGFLGVQITPVSTDVAAALGLEAETGAFVTGVASGTPAETAGLQRGDIVLSVNGADIRTPRDLTRSIATDTPGADVSIQLLRAGQPLSVTVTLGNRADQQA